MPTRQRVLLAVPDMRAMMHKQENPEERVRRKTGRQIIPPQKDSWEASNDSEDAIDIKQRTHSSSKKIRKQRRGTPRLDLRRKAKAKKLTDIRQTDRGRKASRETE